MWKNKEGNLLTYEEVNRAKRVRASRGGVLTLFIYNCGGKDRESLYRSACAGKKQKESSVDKRTIQTDDTDM